jgi:hypothetical protein
MPTFMFYGVFIMSIFTGGDNCFVVLIVLKEEQNSCTVGLTSIDNMPVSSLCGVFSSLQSLDGGTD